MIRIYRQEVFLGTLKQVSGSFPEIVGPGADLIRTRTIRLLKTGTDLVTIEAAWTANAGYYWTEPVFEGANNAVE